MALNSNALTTLAFAKTYLKIPALETSKDSLVEFWINAASQYIENGTERKLKAQSLVEYVNGRKANFILTSEWPINSISEIKVDASGDFSDASTIMTSSEYAIGENAQVIVLKRLMFPLGYRNIKVTYNAGYATIPSDLEDACLWLVKYYSMMQDSGDIGRPSKSKSGEGSTVSQSAPQHVLDIMANYTRCECANSPRDVRNE